jgi:ornithine cyclodeaminase/alanine dehydrogenase-like protein (mu-crystallin family)
VTALACEKLARQDTREAGLIGAGVQGRVHVEMLPEVLSNLERIKVMDRVREVAEGLQRDLQPSLADIQIEVCDTIEEAVRGSLVVVTAAAIKAKPDPQIRDSWVEPGAFLAPVDFDTMWEWETFSRADKFIVDSLEEMEYFMTVGYLPNGLPPLHAEIGEVVAGIKVGREREDELIIDMNIGMGVEDVVVATEIFKRACDRDMGRLLPL